MRVLIVGGTGLISTGIIKHLLARGAEVTMFNRGLRPHALPAGVEVLHGDRNHFDAFEQLFADKPFEVVIDMICFNREQAESDVRAFGGRCEHFLFCSTVCAYGVKVPPRVLIDEEFPREPISAYGRGKADAEHVFRRADRAGHLPVTIVRPSHTYGPGHPLIDNLEFDSVAWGRIARGLPVLCAGDGLGLWVSTHRDDCGKFFAYAAHKPKTFGRSYNATRREHLTWREYYRQVAAVLGKPARLLFMPAAWIVKHDPVRFRLLAEITAFHGAYDSSRAREDVPEFDCRIDLPTGAAEAFEDLRRRGAWRSGEDDPVYQSMVDEALAAGAEPVEA